MVLANEFTHDTRVYKEAQSLIAWGCDVHVLAMTGVGLPVAEVQDGISVHRIDRPRGAVWRLPIAAAVWWCPPLLRRLFPAVPPPRAESSRPTVPPASAALPPPPAPPAPANSDAPAPPDAPATPDAPPADVDRGSAVWRRRFRGAARRILGPDLTHDFAEGARRVRRGGVRRLRRAPHALARPVVRRLRAIYPSSLRLLAFNVPCVGHTLALEPDVILCHDLNTLATGVIAKRLTGRPLLYDSHELFLERNLGARSRGWDRVVWGPVEWLSIGRCDAVFTVAEGIARHLARQYGITRPKLIRNVQPYEPPAPRTTLLADELDVPADHAIVLYPGAITVHRGLEELIDSAPYLQRAVYVIMGYARNPAYLESLRERARRLGVLDERVRFRDAVPINDVVRYTGSADLGIVPTQRICLSYEFEASNKIFHCLMAGVPLAMSNHIEKRMLVERHGIGVLFDETDPRAIAQAVNDLLGDDAVRRRMRAACLEAARTLNWEREEHTLRSVFKDLLGDRVPEVPPVRIAPRSTPASPSTPPPTPPAAAVAAS